MPVLTAAEKFQGCKKFKVLAEETGYSVDALYDAFNGGFLEAIETPEGLQTTHALIVEAWKRRAEARLQRRGVQPRRTDQSKAKRDRKERLDALCKATFGVPAGTGEGV